MTLLVLMDHPCTTCGSEDAKLLDHDGCLEQFLAAGGEREDYDPVTDCGHYACAACEMPF